MRLNLFYWCWGVNCTYWLFAPSLSEPHSIHVLLLAMSVSVPISIQTYLEKLR